MAITLDQPVYYVVRFETRFTSLAEVQREAPEKLAAHMHRSQQLHAAGKLLMAGAFLDHPDEPLSTMGVLVSREAAQDYIDNDPFVRNGMATVTETREWNNMFA